MSYKWFNNGERDIKVYDDLSIPIGFVAGRLTKGKPAWNKGLTKDIDDRVAKYSTKGKNKGKIPWNKGLTKETNEILLIVSQKVSKTRIELRIKPWNLGKTLSIEHRKNLSIAFKGKIPWNKGLTKETNESVMQISIHKTGVPNSISAEKLRIAKAKEYQTKRINHSFNSSQPEEDLYKSLVLEYGLDNVVRQYYDSRYPFPCDFYIKSEDLFIELNYSWVHGHHSFDLNNPLDIARLVKLKEKALKSNYYKYAIYVWTVRDPLKLLTMRENHLNFKVIYKDITITE